MPERLMPPAGAPMDHTRVMRVEIDHAALATRAEGDGEAELIPIAISSEFPVERYDWWEGERYLEVLDHSPEAIDLSRAERGLPFLDAHNAYEGRAQMGRILNVRVEDGRLRGDVKFSRRQEAQDYRQDMLDGIRTDISVGYRIDPNNLEISKADGELKTVRVKRWMPYEASGVAVPADPTVGVGRSQLLHPDTVAQIAAAVRSTHPAPAPSAEERPVPDSTTATPTNGAATATITRDEREAEIRDISALADMHAVQDRLPKWIANGTSRSDVIREIKEVLAERIAKGPTTKPIVELTARETKQYSFARALANEAEGERGFEHEISAEIAKHLPTGYTGQKRGLFVPTNVGMAPEALQRAGLDSGTATKGTELKFTQQGSFIDLLRNKARVLQLGATMLAGLDGPVTFPTQAGAGTASWVAENPGADVAESNLTFGTVSMAAKSLQSTTSFSKQLLRQAVIDVEALVRNDLVTVHGLAVDKAAIDGPGTGNQPTGILSTAGVGVFPLGTNGAAPDYNAMVGLEFTVENANANTGPMGYLTTPGIKATLKTTQKFATTNGESVWTGGEEGQANGYPAYSSKQVPANLTKGTGTNLHAILFGVWANLYIGEWGAMEILVDPYRLKKQGMIEVTSFQMVDIALRYAVSMAVAKDAISAF